MTDINSLTCMSSMINLHLENLDAYRKHRLSLIFLSTMDEMLAYLAETYFELGYSQLNLDQKRYIVRQIMGEVDKRNLAISPTCHYLKFSISFILDDYSNKDINEYTLDELVSIFDQIIYAAGEYFGVTRVVLDSVSPSNSLH